MHTFIYSVPEYMEKVLAISMKAVSQILSLYIWVDDAHVYLQCTRIHRKGAEDQYESGKSNLQEQKSWHPEGCSKAKPLMH